MSTVKELIEICKFYRLPFSKKNKSELQEIIKQFEQKADNKDEKKAITKSKERAIIKPMENDLVAQLELCEINDDISEKKGIKKIYQTDITNKWIKLISNEDVISFDIYKHKKLFINVANIVIDDDTKKNGEKLRNTIIKFNPKISVEDFNNEETEWIYIFTINNKIVKIGGTRVGLKGRCSSYLCGHHIKERGKSGDCSKTNGFIYNTFVFYANLGCDIKMYGYKLPKEEIEREILGKKIKILLQSFHAYESRFMEDYKKQYKKFPILCDNCDPNYKD